jgi:hypothetical protein
MNYIGIDVSPGKPHFTLAALDGERKLAALSQGPLAEMLAYASGQGQAIIAISAPARPQAGGAALQESLPTMEGLPSFEGLSSADANPAASRAGSRTAEVQLAHRGIVIPRTPAQAEGAPAWMQRGFVFYAQLAAAGYRPYPEEGVSRRWLETQAEAAYHNLLGLAPFPAGTLEGRIQRQLVLRNEELPVKDAMDFFEEVTRHKLLRGILPVENIHPQNELNALLAAQTAWLAVEHPDRLESFGSTAEGCLYLPKPKER